MLSPSEHHAHVYSQIVHFTQRIIPSILVPLTVLKLTKMPLSIGGCTSSVISW
jgi:hypothetical protein